MPKVARSMRRSRCHRSPAAPRRSTPSKRARRWPKAAPSPTAWPASCSPTRSPKRACRVTAAPPASSPKSSKRPTKRSPRWCARSRFLRPSASVREAKLHRSYRFARRSFLAGLGGAFALKIMLRDFEAMAQGMKSPPRFLMMHWPVGTIKHQFLPNGMQKPQGVGSITQWSPILQPFQTKGLAGDMSLFWGLRDEGPTNGAGGHEGGTPMSSTGTGCPGTRSNGGEADDGVAGGPSWEQIILENVKDDMATGAVAMKRPGIGYANAICDQRIDAQETSCRCLSYSHQTQQIQAANTNGMITEHVPLLPELAPAQLYTKLFSGFMP